MKKVLFVLSSWEQFGNTGEKTGWWMSEAAHPWKKLKDAGFDVDFVSPMGGEPPVTGVDMNDPVNKEFMEDAVVAGKLKNTLTPSQVNKEDYVAIHYVGGHGACWDFPDNTELAALCTWFFENGRIVSAVCHGPSGLINVKLSSGVYLLKGKKVTGFSDKEEKEIKRCHDVPFLLQEQMMLRGGIYVIADNWSVNVQIDGRLVTGQNPQSAAAVGDAMVKLIAQYKL